MGRIRVLIISAALASALGFMGAPGCTSEDATVVILQNQAPTMGCMVSSSSSDAYVPRGFIDAQANAGYFFTPLLRNFATSTSTAGEGRRIAFLEGAEIRLDFPAGLLSDAELSDLSSRNLVEFSQPFSAAVSPNGGLTSVVFELIPVPVLQALRGPLPEDGTLASIQATVQVFGKLGGSSITTQEFVYWVDVCDGCAKNQLGDCALVDPSADIRTGGVCNLLQDGFVDCCTQAGEEVCPAAVSNMAFDTPSKTAGSL